MKSLSFAVLFVLLIILLTSSSLQAGVAQQTEFDFVLKENEVFRVKDEEFKVYGNVFLRENATLIMENGFLSLMQNTTKYNVTLMDQSQLLVMNGSRLQIKSLGGDSANVSSVERDALFLGDDSAISVSDSFVQVGIAASNYSSVSIQNSTLAGLTTSDYATLSLQDTRDDATEEPKTIKIEMNSSAQIWDSNFSNLEVSGGAEAWIENSFLGSFFAKDHAKVWILNSTIDPQHPPALGGFSEVWLVDSSFNGIGFRSGNSVLVSGWYLDVQVANDTQPVENANVEIYYAQHDSLAAEGQTDRNGTVRFVLPEKKQGEYGALTEILGNYNVKASHEGMQGEEKLTLNQSKLITLNLRVKEPLPVASVPSYLTILGLVVIIVSGLLVAALVARKYLSKRRQAETTQR